MLPRARARRVALVCGGAAASLAAIGSITDFPPRTWGVKNIEDRYSSGGGSKDHLPGAASPRGRSDLVDGRNEGTSGNGDPKFRAAVAEQQLGSAVATQKKPPKEPNKLNAKAVNGPSSK